MIRYNRTPVSTTRVAGVELASFVTGTLNADSRTVQSFGEEWNRFSSFTDDETRRAGEQYFDIVTSGMANASTIALDLGCGTGRWSKYLSPRVGFVEAVDPGDAVLAAVPYTAPCGNIRVTRAGYGSLPFEPASFDFVFSLGVVHHLPDTGAAIREAASMVKPNGWLLLYIYYNLDNRGTLHRLLFRLADRLRRSISTLPRSVKFGVCEVIAVAAYGPFVLLSRLVRLVSESAAKSIPLSYYADKPWKVVRNDSLDRFGTPLEKRFSRAEIHDLLVAAGMTDIRFSDHEPFWHVVARRPARIS